MIATSHGGGAGSSGFCGFVSDSGRMLLLVTFA
jgi:hypothetical protein